MDGLLKPAKTTKRYWWPKTVLYILVKVKKVYTLIQTLHNPERIVHYNSFCVTGVSYILVCLVWSCHWFVETWTGSLVQKRAAQCSERCLCRLSGWAPASLLLLLDQWRRWCSVKPKWIWWMEVAWWDNLEQDRRENQTLAFDLTTLFTLSFKATSTAVSLAATVLLSWPVTGSRLFEIAGDWE